MPREPAIHPSASKPRQRRRRKAYLQESWPDVRRFYPATSTGFFEGIACRFAAQLVPGQNPLYLRALASEATKRVLLVNLGQCFDNNLAWYRSEDASATIAVEPPADSLYREMVWERERFTLMRGPFLWRQFAMERRFVNWMQQVPAADVLRWARRYETHVHRPLQQLRTCLSLLAPMPDEIHRAFFFATTSKKQLAALAGIEYELDLRTEQHVASVCQRLWAYRCRYHTRHGPAHVVKIADAIEKRKAQERTDWRTPAEMRELAHMAGVSMQGRFSKGDVDVAMLRVWAALHRAEAILEGRDGIRAKVVALLPRVLAAKTQCAICRMSPVESSDRPEFPPFQPKCQCFELSWCSAQLPELERRAMLWALECVLGHEQPPWFPFEELIAACALLRSGGLSSAVSRRQPQNRAEEAAAGSNSSHEGRLEAPAR